MHIKVGFVFLIFTIVVLTLQVEAAPVDDADVVEGKVGIRDRVKGEIKKIKDSDLSEEEKHRRIAVIRHNLKNKYKKNHKEIVDVKEVYESQKEVGKRLRTVHVADMTDDEKESIGNLKKGFNHNMQEIQRVLATEHKKQLDLKRLLRGMKTSRGKDTGDGGR